MCVAGGGGVLRRPRLAVLESSMNQPNAGLVDRQKQNAFSGVGLEMKNAFA